MAGIKTIILGCFLLFFAEKSISQDTTIQLISKMDFQPNYELWDGNQTLLMGYTELLGDTIDLPSPTIVLNEGDSVELKLRNMSQPPAHTIHLHGLDVDQMNDGVPHLSFIVSHGETKSYFFKAPHPGTYIYHCHVFSTLHVQGGMYGLLIVKPSNGSNTTWDGGYSYDREYSWLSSEIDTIWHEPLTINHPYDSTQATYSIPDFNPQYFLINGKSEQQLYNPSIQIDADANEVLYLRLANIGFYGTEYIFPAELNATIISGDGRPLPSEEISDTLKVFPGERYGVLLRPTALFNDSVQVNYFNLNTGLSENQQKIAVNVNGFLQNIDTDLDEEFIVYPNPAKELIYIQTGLNESETVDIQLISMEGKISFSSKNKGNQLKISTLNIENGLYIIQIAHKKGLLTKKIIIHH
jgi:FtsP/CotA-like multicopper oxidase with cupredoxin domain